MNFAKAEGVPSDLKPVSVSLLIPSRDFQDDPDQISKTLGVCHDFFTERLNRDPSETFEILFIPNSGPHSDLEKLTVLARELAKPFSSVIVVPHASPPTGKGAALKTGFKASRGQWIGFIDSDLPYGLEFFPKALQILKEGSDFVTGNRRLAESLFQVPVSLLRLAHGRHRLGVLFNRVVKFLFGLDTTDTQSGIKVMNRTLAARAFSKQSCPGFFFDLEIFLICKEQGFSHIELPVTLFLRTEKSTVRILREFFLAIYWLGSLKCKQIRGTYLDKASNHRVLPLVLKHVKLTSFLTRFFLYLRWKLTPYHRMSKHLPTEGQILDLGCGHGLFSILAALESSKRKILALDHDLNRIEKALVATKQIPNLRFENNSLLDFFQSPNIPGEGVWDGIVAIDVLHYMDSGSQSHLIKTIYENLNPGGVFVMREVEPNSSVISRWNRFYEKWATRVGFTQSNEQNLCFRSSKIWLELLRKTGFRVHCEPCSHFLFSDILFIAVK